LSARPAPWLAGYRRAWLRADGVAGLTLAAYAIPEAMAYAYLAGLPPQAGLYCYLTAGIGYALFAGPGPIAVGPTSAIAMLLGATLPGVAGGDPTRLAGLAGLTAVLVAAVAFGASALRLAGVVRFVSETVLAGFRIGAALTIASTQIPKLFGLEPAGSRFFGRVAHLLTDLPAVHGPSAAVGLAALALLVAARRLLPRRPVALAVVAVAIGASALARLGERGVALVGQLPRGLPLPGLPGVGPADAVSLLPLALACFLLGYVEQSATARSFALARGEEDDAGRELLGLGAANLLVGIFRGFPVAGGMSQSAVAEQGGARTPLSGLVAAAAVAAVLLGGTGLFRSLPEPVLAALVLSAVGGLIDVASLRELRRLDPFEFGVALVALLGVLALGILQGVLVASIFSLLVLIRRIARPRIEELGRFPGSDRFGELDRHPENRPDPGVLALGVYSGVVYFNVESVRDEVMRRARTRSPRPALVVLDLVGSGMDLAGARGVARLRQELARQGVELRLAEVQGDVRQLLAAAGAADGLGPLDRRRSTGEVIAAWQAEGARVGV
jgi:SulP family sulfate permease